MIKSVRISVGNDSQGFTLIELMIVIFIIAILAAIAIPNYRRYAVLNAERDAQAKMLQLQVQLERWRASALSYKGFQPQIVATGDAVSYGYDADNKVIYVPQGTDATNYRYQITLVDGVDTTKSLVTSGTTIDSSTGRTWRMHTVPNTTGIIKNANSMLFTSTGIRCQNKSPIDIAADDCGINQEQW